MGHFSMEKSLNPGSVLGGNQQAFVWAKIGAATVVELLKEPSMRGTQCHCNPPDQTGFSSLSRIQLPNRQGLRPSLELGYGRPKDSDS
jgi:hypothetical protein